MRVARPKGCRLGGSRGVGVSSWPHMPAASIRRLEESNGAWVRSQQVARMLRLRAAELKRFRSGGAIAEELEDMADRVERGDKPAEKD